jgi:ferredoxin-NADP reductase
MISLGTGIAPFLSILDQAAKNKNNWQLKLFHSNRYKK